MLWKSHVDSDAVVRPVKWSQVEMGKNPNHQERTPEPRFCQEPNPNPKVKKKQEPEPNPTREEQNRTRTLHLQNSNRHEPNSLKVLNLNRTEALSSVNPNQTRTQNFGFFPICSIKTTVVVSSLQMCGLGRVPYGVD